MKTIAIAAFALAASLLPAFAQTAQPAPQGPSVTGRIVRFECGDNCWLVIDWGGDRKLSALCLARDCKPWNEAAEMPRRFLGRKVTATLGAGIAVNGGGEIQDYALAFTALKLQ